MENYVGEIKAFAGDYAPYGWVFCNGQLLPIDGYSQLFGTIGKQFGGDGITNFAVPNLCGRVAIGQSPNHPLATFDGTEQVTLTTPQLPVHSHPVNASASAPDVTGPAKSFWASAGHPYGAAPGNTIMNPGSVDATPPAQSHENRVPFVAISYIIAYTFL